MFENAAIIGVGQSAYTRRPEPGQTALYFMRDAVVAALKDAELNAKDIDGMAVASFSLAPDAAGRTLFIEELAALDGSAQDDLMRLLESSVNPLLDDIRETRIISSTAHNPVERLASRLFDTDLFYRLNTIHIALDDERRLASPSSIH